MSGGRAALAVLAALAVVSTGAPALADDRLPDRRPAVSEQAIPDLLDVGRAGPPSRDVAAVISGQQRRSTLAATPTPGLPDFQISGAAPVAVGDPWLPYALAAPVGKTVPTPSTETGVPLRLVDGVAHEHPSNQAVFGLRWLESYRLTGDRWYLTHALAAGQHLVDKAVRSRDALWFAYTFDFAVAGDASVNMPAPWYSAMAQGGALSLFTRLWQTTQDATWLTAATETMRSLSLPPAEGLPWVTHVDDGGLLWLEEYPRLPTSRSERVLNGSIFAIYGVYDYLRLVPVAAETEQLHADGRRVFDGAVTTVRQTAATAFRRPSWISRYSLLHNIANAHYQAVHREQLLSLQHLTGTSWFAQVADVYRADYPDPVQPGQVTFVRGWHTGYRFDSGGRVTGHLTKWLPSASSAPADRRQRIRLHGIYYRVTKGAFAGYWVPEAASRVALRRFVLRHDYLPHRPVTLAAGTWTGYRFVSGTTTVSSSTRATYSRPTSTTFIASAVINGRLHVLVDRGRYAGYWLPVLSGVSLG